LYLSVFLQDSKLDVTIGPYETYEDKLFGYKVIPNNETYKFLHSLKLGHKDCMY